MKLSIIIPYFNTWIYTDELLSVLDPQIVKGVEVILVDDGSDIPYRSEYKWLKIIRQENGGQGKARNKGLSVAKGEYIQFVDSDDIVAPDFVSQILEKAKEDPDVIEFSWRSLTPSGAQFNFKIRDGKRLPNPSACTRTFKRSFIGPIRFSEVKDAAEDEDFSRRLGYLEAGIKVSVIPDYMYFYRTDVENSNVKGYKQGCKRTKRVVYFYEHVTADRTDILEAIKKDDEQNEVFLMTGQCDIPEMKRWCQIIPPMKIWTHYQKGEPFKGLEIIQQPEEAQVILFIRYLHEIGGIETFVYQFAKLMHKDYDIALVVETIDEPKKKRLQEYIRVIPYHRKSTYKCDTLVMLRVLDKMPRNVAYNQSVQMCHACKTNNLWHIPQWSRYIVNVSQASKDSFGPEAKAGIVIHNPIEKNEKKALILVSATRIPAPDKGMAYEARMKLLADMLNEAEIPFVWFNFSEGQLTNAPAGMVNMGMRQDITPYIARADYLVQLSDSEAWSYSILEALTQNVPVLVCPFPSAYEMGIEDGKNGYILPFSMEFDIHKILDVPEFEYEYSNEPIKKQWCEIFDHKAETEHPDGVVVYIVQTYNDIQLDRIVNAGEQLFVTKVRAEQLIDAGFAKKAGAYGEK